MTIKETVVNGHQRWRVDWRVSGVRRRKIFKSKTTAERFAGLARSDIKEQGAILSALRDYERSELIACHRRAKVGDYTLTRACDYYEGRRLAKSGVTLGELIEKCTAAKTDKGLVPESLRQLKMSWALFAVGRGKRLARDIKPAEIAEFVNRDGWGPWRRKGVLTDLKTLFSWGVRMEHLERNPALPVEPPVIPNRPPPLSSPPNNAGSSYGSRKGASRTLYRGSCSVCSPACARANRSGLGGRRSSGI